MQAVPQDSIAPDAPPFLEQIAGFFRVSPGLLIQRVVEIAVIWVGAWIAIQVLRLASRRLVRMVSDHDDRTLTASEKRGHTIAQLVRSAGRAAILLVALLLTLDLVLDIRTLLAGFGILGLAVSFGAQSLVKDVISGFFILAENQFVVGDVIDAAGRSGVVERIGLRAVMLRDVDGALHIIPNGQIAVVSNKTRSWSRAVVEVGVNYDVDLDRTLQIFRDEADRFYRDRAWNARFEGAPEVPGVEQLTDTRVIIRTLLRTVPGSQWDVAREFRRRLKNRLAAEGIHRVRTVARAEPSPAAPAGEPAPTSTPAPAPGLPRRPEPEFPEKTDQSSRPEPPEAGGAP
ncbi:MAG TPA: mechanosensitive ion channel domain-containing protein [Gemmatimonadales bacterium]|nr:mechanosensitive ion channel domain-containing protein [Gemmatimonadales bacterium]